MVDENNRLRIVHRLGPPKAPIRVLYIGVTSNTAAGATRAQYLSSLIPPDVHLEFYQPPETAPKSINGTHDGILSAACVLGELDEAGDWSSHYAAIVIGCFSTHPLTAALRESPSVGIPIVSLVEAGICAALQLCSSFGIATSGKQWEPLLDEAVRAMGLITTRYVGCRGCGMDAAGLHDSKEDSTAAICQAAQELVMLGARVIVLGCASMSPNRLRIETTLSKWFGSRISVIDPVQAAVDQAIAFARMGVRSP